MLDSLGSSLRPWTGLSSGYYKTDRYRIHFYLWVWDWASENFWFSVLKLINDYWYISDITTWHQHLLLGLDLSTMLWGYWGLYWRSQLIHSWSWSWPFISLFPLRSFFVFVTFFLLCVSLWLECLWTAVALLLLTAPPPACCRYCTLHAICPECVLLVTSVWFFFWELVTHATEEGQVKLGVVSGCITVQCCVSAGGGQDFSVSYR